MLVQVFNNEAREGPFEHTAVGHAIILLKDSLDAAGNRPPGIPVALSPPDGSVEQSVVPVLSWACSDPDEDELYCDLYFGRDDPPPLYRENLTGSSITTDSLDQGSLYHWKITAKDWLVSSSGPVWSFTTKVLNQPPNANAGPDITAETVSFSGAEITLDPSASSDPDGDALICTWKEAGQILSGPAPQGPVRRTLPLGIHEIVLVVEDGKGGSDSDTILVTVQDTTPPVLTVSLNPDTLWPPDHKMVQVLAAVAVSDFADPSPSFILHSIESSEPDDAAGAGDGNTVGDIQEGDAGTPDTSFLLRAERDGGGEGRFYRIVYRAYDLSGNVSTAKDSVIVLKSNQ